ncbi:MAG TPA: helix-turn-helix domain-containing protein [Longimicrobium sp.]|jgi:DNA-binding transcriptional ArsR family regulator
MSRAAASAALQVVRESGQAAAMLHPERVRLLGELAEPESAAGLARRLGIPRQRLGYHLRELEKEGLVELVEERRKGNCTERLVRATARSYLISPEVLGPLAGEPARVADRFSVSYLIAVVGRALRDLAVLRARSERAGKKLATLTLETEVRFATAADRAAFAEELADAVARLAAKYHAPDAPGGRAFRFFLGAHPTITRTEEDPDA